jgi:hypothetical protein
MVTGILVQGWCTDPWGRYEERWFSAGRPTELVRSQGRELSDPVPRSVPDAMPAPVSWGDGQADGIDLLRSDRASASARHELAQAARGMLTRTHD